ncbi:uncharacterized protein [Cherax quadricarinatus]|uniref:uncharacterized protein n=1 Tax=Cherax quadricarinatus TaxID=27406 RepID=UPI00387E4567
MKKNPSLLPLLLVSSVLVLIESPRCGALPSHTLASSPSHILDSSPSHILASSPSSELLGHTPASLPISDLPSHTLASSPSHILDSSPSHILVSSPSSELLGHSPASLPSSDLPSHTLGNPRSTASEIELQRAATKPFSPSQVTSAKTGDYSEAIYAARLANELLNLEKSKKKVYVDFIYSGFTSSSVPRSLPSDLLRLSRTIPVSSSVGGGDAVTFTTGNIGHSTDVVFPGARGVTVLPSKVNTFPSTFPAKSFLLRGSNRLSFPKIKKVQRFPFARGAVGEIAK